LPFFLVCGCKYRGFYRTLQISSQLFANFLSFPSIGGELRPVGGIFIAIRHSE
jgi:hypothetical protein